uniref:Uncharacterized protein n=1 Tax=Cannabis sativa TaxID=3483 RepID=A0A803QSN9_CANSA
MVGKAPGVEVAVGCIIECVRTPVVLGAPTPHIGALLEGRVSSRGVRPLRRTLFDRKILSAENTSFMQSSRNVNFGYLVCPSWGTLLGMEVKVDPRKIESDGIGPNQNTDVTELEASVYTGFGYYHSRSS